MGFSRFNLSPQLFQAITNLGFAEPTPIQAGAIPDALKGRDVRASAQTGTGKTLAFMVPIVEKLIRHPAAHKPSALVLTPTRELAAQVITVAHDLIKHTRIRTALVLGGTSYGKQINALRAGPDIVVATPGRLQDLIDRGNVSLRHVHTLVLDEADRMLDMGFLPAIKRILTHVPVRRQTMLFSATFGAEIKKLAHDFLHDPAVVDLSPVSAPSENVTQIVYPVAQSQKRALFQALLELGNMTSVLVFTRTKHGADKLFRGLHGIGKTAAVIHSNRSQNQRQMALDGFKSRRYQVLVATDIAARGIDVKDISHVINYDVPRSPEDYVHRIGRTGRAQAVGEAFTLVSPDEEPYLKRIERHVKKPIPRAFIPDFPYDAQPRIAPASPSHHAKPHGRPHPPQAHRGHPKPRWRRH